MQKYYNYIDSVKFQNFQSLIYYAIHEKILRTFFIDVQNVKYILSDPISVLTPSKVKIKQCQLKK